MSEDTVISKEMGITHAEFFRNIPRVIETDTFSQNEGGIIFEDGIKRLTISISEQGERRIALFVLPVTPVKLTFTGYSEEDIQQVIEKFDRAFQRGGG